ncbi:MAG: hypothetical protein J1E36_05060 [Eubacterium sp.]|nr:hypothetical protein [Eubacterium sp.]
MSKKKKKKKKKSAERTVKSQKEDYILLCTLIFMIAFKLLYDWLLELIMLKAYSPYYFASTKSSSYIILPFLFIVFFAVALYILPDRKISNKKYISITSVILSITLALTIIFSSNVWVFNENSISYNTLFQKDKVVYTYDDIDSAELYYETWYGVKGMSSAHLIYNLNMNDDKEIEIDIPQSFYKDNNKLFQFDNMISDKRKVIGEYVPFDNKSDKFNEYYQSLFKNS